MRAKYWFVLCTIIILLIIITIFAYIYVEQKTKQPTIVLEVQNNNSNINNTKKIEIETDKEDDASQAIQPVSLGEFRLTGYCGCPLCCGSWSNNRPIDENGNEIVYGAIGEELKEGYSIAVDPDVIPYKSEVVINGHTYRAQDCGGAIKGNRIDVYFENHNDALEFGVQYAEVFVNL